VRIALSHPWCWPAVQRGGERLFADLGRYLVDAGHDVLTVSAGPTPARETSAAGGRVVLEARARPVADRLHVDQSVTYLPRLARELRRFQPDVFHGMFHFDGAAGRLAGVSPRVVHIQGIPRRRSLRGRPLHRQILRLSMAPPTVAVAVSHAAADALAAEFGYEARVVHNGVDTAPFDEAGRTVPRHAAPTVLFPSSPDDPRKRIDLLVRAVNRLRPNWPDVRLAVAAAAPADVKARVDAASDAPVDWLSTATASDMPAAYARAWVTCAPAVREAFGLVFIESMAAGRPAVGVRDGGVPEVIAEPRWLAAPDDDESLAAAVDAALHDAAEPSTADTCRAHAATFDWRVRGPAFEALYADVVGSRR
jgi:phosphatidyl-myo-inositol alpha-mannosyltransferase